MRASWLAAAGWLVMIHRPVAACTLWGSAGTASMEGSLLAKNRDWKPDHAQSLRLLHPEHGYAYLGLYADNGSEPGIKAGVNQKGLAVVAAEASSLPRALRADSARHGVLTRLLRDYGSLDEVASAADKLFAQARPVFLLLADAGGLMQVEIGQHGRYRLIRQQSGTLAHTNHYADTSLLDGAQTIGPSLWRSGREHTLAGWRIALPAGAPPRLQLTLANPGRAERDGDYALDSAFWAQPARTLLP